MADPGAGDGEADRMVLLAALVSRVEALVVGSMLEAGGVAVNVGALGHASVAVNSLVLGGHRLWVPASQHRFASELLEEVLGEEEWAFSRGLQRAVLRFLGFCGLCMGIAMGAGVTLGGLPPAFLIYVPLSVLSVPVNPQGRGDYFLAEPDPTAD